ncbi:MAG TPA: hypothetical protein QF646_06430, partial [Candidatus Poseidoniales archaeon]|nr:hypothetical protein [Candidatus Poseidoniales archaeon]
MGGNRASVALVVTLILTLPFAGCFGEKENEDSEEVGLYPAIWDRHLLEWNTSGTHSILLESGPNHALDVQEATIDVDTSAVWESGPAASEVH